MRTDKIKFLISTIFILSIAMLPARSIKWLAVSDLQSWFSSDGCEIEVGRTGSPVQQIDGLRYPALYEDQDVQCQKSLWIGTANYTDPTDNNSFYDYKVVNIGPRGVDTDGSIFNVNYKLIGKTQQPNVTVDGVLASKLINLNPSLDEIDPDLPCDHMIYNEINTSMGISFTRKVRAFTNNYHQAYHIYEYEFTNTGIYSAEGDSTHDMTLDSVYFYWTTRYAINHEATIYGLGLLPQAATWGRNTMNHFFGRQGNWGADMSEELNVQGTMKTIPNTMRGYFAWQGSAHNSAISHAPDFGAPDYMDNDRLTSVQFPGVVIIHADSSSADSTDDPMQPVAWQSIASDLKPHMKSMDQYDSTTMAERYAYMRGSKPAAYLEKTHAQYVIDADQVPLENMPDWPGNTGGLSSAMGFGPYTLAHNESVKIVFAEAVGSISMEERRRAGQFYRNGYISLEEKDGVICQGVDSLFQYFERAVENYESGYSIPFPPEAPESFSVITGCDSIALTWARNSESSVGFSGYRLYRAMSRYDSTYHLLLDITNPEEYAIDLDNCQFIDSTLIRDVDYYYYITAYDDGSVDELGRPLSSSKYYTLTSIPAQLKDTSETSIHSDPNDVPLHFALKGNYPNPFNPLTTILFDLQKSGKTTMDIFNINGKKIETLINENMSSGSYQVIWDANPYPSGVYIVRLQSKEYIAYQKMMLLK